MPIGWVVPRVVICHVLDPLALRSPDVRNTLFASVRGRPGMITQLAQIAHYQELSGGGQPGVTRTPTSKISGLTKLRFRLESDSEVGGRYAGCNR